MFQAQEFLLKILAHFTGFMTAETASRALGILNAFMFTYMEWMYSRHYWKSKKRVFMQQQSQKCILSPRITVSFKHGLFPQGLVYKSSQTTAETLFNDQAQSGHLNLCYESLMDNLKSSTALFNHKNANYSRVLEFTFLRVLFKGKKIIINGVWTQEVYEGKTSSFPPSFPSFLPPPPSFPPLPFYKIYLWEIYAPWKSLNILVRYHQAEMGVL